MCVWSMPGLDLIVGLPHILRHFLDLFTEMLTDLTRAVLSIQTPWGQVEPAFLRTSFLGVGPASLVPQKHVMSIFADRQDFMITIFDNLLVLGGATIPGILLKKVHGGRNFYKGVRRT
eukprot:gene13754-29249_t